MLLEGGQIIDGKYRIVRLIGTGGMGAVYEGENILIRRRVAIKVLNAASAGNEDVIRRFEREAQAAGEIGNDHILEVLDLGSLSTGDRFMVMEYLDGETLAARIERHGRLTPAQIAPIARQFLTALASAHAAGIIHRDLKPENIFILRSKAGRTDFVKLIDFGISKFSRPFEQGEIRQTRADAIFGTPCYMSPEQARGAAVADVRSDIYSCGVILFESVTGRLPFEADSFNDLMFKIALSDAPSPLTLVPALDPDFAWLITKAVARDPEQRFATVRDFAEKLDEWMRKNALTETMAQPPPPDAFPARAPAPAHGPVTGPSGEHAAQATVSLAEKAVTDPRLLKTGPDGSWAQSQPTELRGRRRGTRVMAIALALALLGVAGLLVLRPVAMRGSTAAAAAPLVSSPSSSAPPPSEPVASAEHPATASASAAEPTKLKHEVVSKPSLAPKPSPAAARPKPGAPSSPKGFDLGY